MRRSGCGRKRATVLAGSEVSEDEEEEVSTPDIGSPKGEGPPTESEPVEPITEAKEAIAKTGEKNASQKDITAD